MEWSEETFKELESRLPLNKSRLDQTFSSGWVDLKLYKNPELREDESLEIGLKNRPPWSMLLSTIFERCEQGKISALIIQLLKSTILDKN